MMPSKNQIIDRLNEEFEELQNKASDREYSKVLNAIQKQVIETFEKKKTLKRSDITKAIKDNPLNIDKFDRNTFTAYILSGITSVIENGKRDARLRNIMLLVSLYDVTRPKELAKAVTKVTNQYFYNNQKLSPKEKRLYSYMKQHYDSNIRTIGRIAREQDKLYKDIHRKVTSNLSQNIMNDLKKWNRDKDGTPLTFAERDNKLRDKYGNAAYRVERIIRTETHAQNETVKYLDMKNRGYKQKLWVNQKDNKVRTSHKGSPLTTQWIDINSKFELTGSNETALYPGDNSLSAGERINCRCFAKYRR